MTDDPVLARDAALYEMISKHGLRLVVFNASKEEAATIAGQLTERFAAPFLRRQLAPLLDANALQKLREEAKHAPLFRAIRQSDRP